MENYQFYAELIQPSFAPPAWLFGPVWTILYILIAISFSYIVYLVQKKQLNPRILIPLVINLIANFVFTPVFFGLQELAWGAVLVVIVWVTIIILIIHTWKPIRWVAYMQIPYLLWVSFASVLAWVIVFLN